MLADPRHAYCECEAQRIGLTNQPRILALQQEGWRLSEEERDLADRLKLAPIHHLQTFYPGFPTHAAGYQINYIYVSGGLATINCLEDCSIFTSNQTPQGYPIYITGNAYAPQQCGEPRVTSQERAKSFIRAKHIVRYL